jgi:hypothetical protein
VNDQEEITMTGNFGSVVDFDPDDATTFNVTGNGSIDAFLLKLGYCVPDATTDTQIACESYQWIDGITYNASTTAPTFTYTNEDGCDSVVSLNLTIYPSFTLTISNVNNVLTASVAGATSYQWIDCSTNTPIGSGGTQSFTPNQNGSYAVEVYNNYCTVLSACENVFTIGLEEAMQESVQLFPNPADDVLHVQFDKPTAFSVWNVQGQHMADFAPSQTATLDLSAYVAGVYYIKTNGHTYRFIVQ